MKISQNIPIDAIEYASQGNAILGIRDSGKSYTATYIAERLMESNIPIIAFDPIGVWRYLKVGKKSKGFPIVVAGDNGDLPLTPESAVNIVRAAMKENVSLVIDLYSMSLSKADWKKIVEQCIRLLLYENKNCGLRHIFIEEAAEFAPQRVRPDEGRVYAEIEKLARMGGNASLGYTLINQRAEEVNKAVLELCDCLFLHRQKGRHSLTALGKWLDVADASNSKEIINSLPSLTQGECWIWSQGSHEPKRIQVPEKKTFHPDRRNPLEAKKATHSIATADVSQFVSRMKNTLFQIQERNASYSNEPAEKKTKNKKQYSEPFTLPDMTNDPYQNGTQVAELKLQVQELKERLAVEQELRKQLERKLESVKNMLKPQYEQMKKIYEEANVEANIEASGDYDIWMNKFGGKKKQMLEILIQRKRITRSQLGLLVGMSYTSGSFNTYISELKSVGLIKKDGDQFILQSV